MNTIDLKNKKIGIWGFGIVGKSVLEYLQKYDAQIQIMDRNDHPEISIIKQTPENIIQFLEHNDVIIPSPGIVLLDYQKYEHKFIHELDIFSQHFHGKTIAITGTVGKTTITSLLAQCIPNSIAAGNIGYPMLNVLDMHPTPKQVILELSSYQLAGTKQFAPDFAIWTNFYPNHLDHHKDEQEYFQAKCNILIHQNSKQTALLPLEIIHDVEKNITLKSNIFLFATTQQDQTKYPLFFIDHNKIWLQKNNQKELVFDQLDKLPDITFAQNWLVIIATIYLHNISPQHLLTVAQTLKPEPHRLEFVCNLHKVKVYNDSKSTVWQATKQAIDRFNTQNSLKQNIALFLGGISKGTDRTPLIQHLQNKPIAVFAFGKEAEHIATLCKNYNVVCHTSSLLESALQQYLKEQHKFDILLFSPAGASFDLFKNFEDRGTQFKAMIKAL